MERPLEHIALENAVTINLNNKVIALQLQLTKFLNTVTLDQIDKLDINEMAGLQNKLKDNIEALKLVTTALSRMYDIIRKNKLPELMFKQNVKGISIAGVGKISLVDDVYTSVKSDMQKAAFEWLSDNGHSELIRKTVHPSSLKALIKSKIEGGEEIPEDMFSVYKFTYSRINQEK